MVIKSTSSHASLSHYKRVSDHLWRYSSKSNQEYKREEIEAELMATLSVPATVPSGVARILRKGCRDYR